MTNIIHGHPGDDDLTGTSGNDEFLLQKGGNDIVNGAGGDDIFLFGATFTADDQVDGGTGNDMIFLNGDYSAGVIFAATTMVNVEKIALAAGNDYSLTTNDANVAAGETLTVVASRLGSGNHLTFDGSAETDGHFVVMGGAGDDTLTGGAQSDHFYLGQGGNDTVHAGGGNDHITMGGSFTAGDQLDGGRGFDVVRLDGTGTASVVFGATTMVNVEDLILDGGHSYNLTTNDATVAGGQFMEIDGYGLTAGDTLTFNGAAETDGAFLIAGGAGRDNVTGGMSSDFFDMSAGGNDTVHGGGGNDQIYMGGALTASDHLNGGGGGNVVILDGNYTGTRALVLAANTLNNIQDIELGPQHSYDITSNDATVAAGSFLIVDGSQLLADKTLSFDGSAETDGNFSLADGLGNDVLIGGLQADFLSFDGGGTDKGEGGGGDDFIDACGHVDPTDQFDGGAGFDTIELTADETSTGSYTGINALHLTGPMMLNFEQMDLDGGGSYDITTVDANVNAGVTFEVDGSDLFSTDTLRFDGSAETDGTFLFHMGGSFVAADQLIGGAGNDTLELGGDYSGGLTFAANSLTSVETIVLDNGGVYNLVSDDGNVAAGTTLTVDASALGFGETVSFDGSAETDGSFAFIGATVPGSVYIGGAQADTFDLTGSYAQATGNGGADTFTLDADGDALLTYHSAADSTSTTYDTIVNANFSGLTLAIPGVPVAAIDATVATGDLNTATFDSDLAAAIGSSQLAAGDAVIFSPTGGSLGTTGHSFLIVDMNGTAGYQAGVDLVIDITGYSGTLSTGNFTS
ncbi:MAG TPA: calcium-binding protein [Rhizomicrobium sp.]|jgi:hypothetical protein